MEDRRIGSKLIGASLVAAAPPSPPAAVPLIVKYSSNTWVREVVTDLARSMDIARAVLGAADHCPWDANDRPQPVDCHQAACQRLCEGGSRGKHSPCAAQP